MTEILYCESSDLLAAPIMEIFRQWRFVRLDDSGIFWKKLGEVQPLIIVLGDSFSSHSEELVFCLKSKGESKEIPLILISENRPGSHLPLNMWIPRFAVDEGQVKGKVKRLIDRETERVREPFDPIVPSSCGESIRRGLEKRIFREYALWQIESISFGGGTLENIADQLLRRAAALFSCSYTYLEFRKGEFEMRRLYCTGLWAEAKRKEVLDFCRKNLPGSFVPVEAEWAISFDPVPADSTAFSGQCSLIANSPISRNSRAEGVLMAGCFSDSPVPVIAGLEDLVAARGGELLEQAAVFFNREAETSALFRAFTRFLPEPIIEDLLLKTSEKDLMTGEKRRIVVLFSHIRNFEYIAEHNEPEQIVRFLNQHFSSMGSIIRRYGGTIDKFIGDAVFAIFGAPISYSDNCQRAVGASIEMIEAYGRNDSSYINLPLGGFHIGIGLNEGEAIIGNIGCTVKFDYTAIGDTVNLAARLESLCKHYQRDILISEVMYRQVKKEYFCRLVDIARVKGKTEPSRIYSLEAHPEDYPDEWRQLYRKGLSMYAMGNWYLAIGYLEQALEILPEDFPTGLFLDRCEEYRSFPPEQWDGSVTLGFK